MARYILVGCAVYALFTGSTISLASFTSDFATSDECMFCHTSGGSALRDGEGNSLSIADDWSSTMMGNSFRDPFFRAKLESEVVRNPQLAAAIEDKCLTCHAPMARTQAISNGTGSYSLSQAETTVFASDGVSCTLCHQIQKDGLGNDSSFSGNYNIGEERKMFGPYKQVFVNPMINHVDYLPTYGEQVDQPGFCATCHTLFTPIVAEDGHIIGEFPEQTPYLEWLNSSYASSENYRSCQDCHMPRIDERVKISNRPPWYQETQSPFWKHHFTGGNVFILEMLKNNRQRLGSPVPEALFEKTIERTEGRLNQEAAEISVVRVKRDNNRLQVDVRVTNQTGHKFPTGFPSRRAWLHLEATDYQKRQIFESGSYTPEGEIVSLDSTYEPHHTIIDSADQVQIYQSIMGDESGKMTGTLLRAATYLKDNRLPPAGYERSGPMSLQTGIKGKAAIDMNFNVVDNQEGSGTDIVTYDFDLKDARFPLTIRVRLLYQSSSPWFLKNLFKDDTPAVSRFKEMYAAGDNRPMVVDQITYELID